MVEALYFQAIGPFLWSGRYKRVPGQTTTFSIRYHSHLGWWPCVDWRTDEYQLECFALSGNTHIRTLAAAINKAKMMLAHTEGGSFQINEFGQVLVPSSAGDGRVMIVGETQGALILENPLTDDYIDLSNTDGLESGSLWDKPYIGQVYNLSKGHQIYCYDDRTSTSRYPVAQDFRLIRRLRAVRRSGPVRFIVNMHGIVLTKMTVGEFSELADEYQPVYIGRIDEKLWFDKEGVY